MINKYIVLFLLISITLPVCLFGVIDLTESEIRYLKTKEHLNVLVSNNNYPYEYFDEKNHIKGIQVDLLKMILDYTKIDYDFITDTASSTPDIISSLVLNHSLKYETKPLYIADVYCIYKDSTHKENIDSYIVLYKEYLCEQIINIYPNQKMVFVDDIGRAIQLLQNSDNKALIFDQFFLEVISKHIDINHINIDKIDNVKLKLFLTIDDITLLNIITKTSIHLIENNALKSIYSSYHTREASNMFINQNIQKLLILLSIVIVLCLTSLALFYYFKVYRFKFEALVGNLNKSYISLMNEIDSMTLQIESFKLDNYYLLENINNFAILLDTNGNILFTNHHCKDLLGYEPEKLIGHNIDEILSKKEKLKILSLTNSNNATFYSSQNIIGGSYQNPNEIEIVNKDGLKKTFLFSTHFKKYDKTSSQICCILEDVSERKKLKNENEAYNQYLNDIVTQRTEALRKSEERIKFVINSVYDSIFMIKDGRFTLVNEAFYSMIGIDQKAINDKHTTFVDIIDPIERDRVWDIISKNMENKINHYVLNTKIIKIDGELNDVEIHLSNISSDDEQSVIGIIHDIAQKKQYEEQKLQAERINTIISVAITTNDFINSPLMAIQGYVEMIEKNIQKQKDTPQKTFLTIYQSIHIIKEKMDELVGFANNPQFQSIPTKKYSFTDYEMLSLKKETPTDEE